MSAAAGLDTGSSRELVACTASAPGKLIFFGEHAVVYGTTAVAAALSDLRIAVAVQPLATERGGAPMVRVTSVDLAKPAGTLDKFTVEWEGARLRDVVSPLLAAGAGANAGGGAHSGGEATHAHAMAPVQPSDEAVAELDTLVQGTECADLDPINGRALVPVVYLIAAILGDAITRQGVRVEIQPVSLPPGAGIGSSAALCVAASAALVGAATGGYEALPSGGADSSSGGGDGVPSARVGAGLAGVDPRPEVREVINQWAFAGETIIHGRPSGLDNTVSCFGGAISYVKEPKKVEPLRQFPALEVLLVNTKVPKDTGKMVAGVRVLRDRMPDVVDPLITSVDGIAKRAIGVLEGAVPDGSDVGRVADELGELVSMNQGLLNLLGVGHAALDTVAAVARKHGFVGKLTGAGGGGCALVLLTRSVDVGKIAEDTGAMVGDLEAAGFETFRTAIGGCGVLLHDVSEAESAYWGR